MKYCPSCKEDHDESEFYKNKSKPDGLSTYCKRYYRNYYESNKERILIVNEIYAETHQQERQEFMKSYNERYRSEHPDIVSTAVSRWKNANPDKVRNYHNKNDTRRRVQTSTSCNHDICQVIDRRSVWGRDEGCCRIKLKCNGVFVPFEEMHLDHIIPLSRNGFHCYYNVQTGCAACNLFKSNN